MGYGGTWSAAQIENILGNSGRHNLLLQRSEAIQEAIESNLWMPQLGYYARGIWSNDSKLDTRYF